jgi:hypothetical protein
MPIAPPLTEEQREIVSSEHLQLLLGCLILGFVLCGSMVVYTNHVKEALTALAQVPVSGNSAGETTAPLSLRTPGLLEETTSIAQPQSLEVSLKAQPNKLASVTSNRKLHPVHHLIGSYLVGLPVAVCLGMFAGLHAWGVFGARALEEIIKVIFFLLRFRTPTWYQKSVDGLSDSASASAKDCPEDNSAIRL